MQLEKPNHIRSLATSAVLVSAEVSVWSATKQDRVISHEVTSAKKADPNAGRYVKNLLADDPTHKQLLNYRQTVYNWFRRSTYEWQGSLGLLPVVNLEKFKREFAEHETTFNDLVSKFEVRYPQIISDMAFKQGDMFDRNEYPDISQVRNKFKIRLYVTEVPSLDFRCQVSDELADDLKASFQSQVDEKITETMTSIATQFAEVMQSISHCCGYDDVVDKHGDTKQKKRKIYDTTLQKAKDLCETFKSFNLTNDAELESASALLEKVLHGVDAEDLRDSDATRHVVKEGIDEILGKFGAFNNI
jgi:hypothetical protein